MKLLLLLVAIYSLIFYQHYKLERSKILQPALKGLSKTELSYKLPEVQQVRSVNAALLNTSYMGYKLDQWKFQAAGFTLPVSSNR